MTFTDKQKKFIDILQWILISLMVALCTIVYIGNIRLSNQEADMKNEYSYIKIYTSHRIDELTKQNKVLTDSIERLQERLEQYRTNKGDRYGK